MDDIGRLRIVCVADRRRSAAALTARSRLERVARSELGEALERQGAGDASVRLGRLSVRLDLDPNDYDDRTLAVLWAGRIRDAILAASASATASAAARRAEGGPSPQTGDGASDSSPAGVSQALHLLARRAIRGDAGATTALAREILAEPAAVARALRLALSASHRQALVRALDREKAGASRPPPRRASPLAAAGHRRVAGPSVRRKAQRVPAGTSWAATLAIASRRWLAGRTPGEAMRPGGSPVHDTTRPRERGGALATAPDPRLASLVAGLGLLWPWLATHLDVTADRLARLDPIEARRLALSALVPDLPAAVDDPVVRLLAGDDLDGEPSLIVVTEGELGLAAEGADAVLDRFAGALPGFSGSTPEFVRLNFLVRAGAVEPAVDPVTVRAAPLPLDPVLSLLGYPIGTFRLPWSRPIALRLEYR